jgi:cytochrome c peroxidase
VAANDSGAEHAPAWRGLRPGIAEARVGREEAVNMRWTMRDWKAIFPGGLLFAAGLVWALPNVSAHSDPQLPRVQRWYASGYQPRALAPRQNGHQPDAAVATQRDHLSGDGRLRDFLEGRRLFERDTFGGNGRTCRTCHSEDTGTVSPRDARKRFRKDPRDPLFIHDGSDDGLGHGVTRMLTDATILIAVPLPANVTLADDPTATSVTLTRGIPTTLNTPALDPVLMLDGRQPDLESQATGAIHDHAEGVVPSPADLHRIAEFQRTAAFFSSPALRHFARGGAAPRLPQGRTASEKRGRRFFEDVPPDPTAGFKPGLCSHCHSGPLGNQTNEFASLFIGLPIPTGARFSNVLVSEFNAANNPVREFVFNPGRADEARVLSPDPGRALITGSVDNSTLENLNAFKISPLRGIRHTAPYFHDNSAKTLDDVLEHYRRFFAVVSDPDGPGPAPPAVVLSERDKKDIVAFLEQLD